MRVLHLSDLHASAATEREQAKLVDALLADISDQNASRRADLVVFSGDLSFDGTSENLTLGKTLLLDPLRKRLPGCPMIIVPGNHDVDRAKVSPIYELGLRHKLTSRESVNDLLRGSDDLEPAIARLAAWHTFADAWDSGLEKVLDTPTTSAFLGDFSGTSVGIVCLDSAWRSQGGPEDKERLLIGEDALDDALEAVSAAEIRLIVLHHPLDWLAGFSATNARQRIDGFGAFVLTGHEHSADPSTEISTRGAALYSRAGCLYETLEYSNSYSILDIDEHAHDVCISIRGWQQVRRTFEPAVHLATEGTISLPWPAPANSKPAQRAEFGMVLSPLVEIAKAQSVLADPAFGLEPKAIGEMLLPPRFKTLPFTPARDTPGASDLDDHVNPVNELAAKRIMIVSGGPSSGVTGALLWILDNHFRRVGTHVPAYVQTDPRLSSGQLKDAFETACARSKQELDDQQAVLLAIDDCAPTDSKALARLVKFLDTHPNTLVVLGCHGEHHAALADTMRDRGITYSRAFLAPFGRKELRLMAERLVGSSPGPLVDRVMRVMDRQGLPRNPLNVAALVAVAARNSDLSTINESGLLQSYVSLLLDNPSGVDPEGLTMDHRRREHFLQCFAERLVTDDQFQMPRADAEAFVIEHFKSMGWKRGSPAHHLDSLINRRVLSYDERGVGFRYTALLDLFAAKQMLEKESFGSYILSAPHRFVGIIRHAAGLRRNDGVLLKNIAAIAQTAIAATPDGVSVDQFDLILDNDDWSRTVDLRRVRDLVRPLPPPPTEEELDAIHDEVAPPPAEESVPTRLGGANELTAMQMIAVSSRLLASVLQNSELVPDVPLKAEVLRTVITAWSIGAVVLAVHEDELGVLRDLLEDNLQEQDADDKRSTAQHLAQEFVFAFMSVMLYGDVGSQHISGVLQEVLEDEQFMSVAAHALFATMLYVLLEIPGWPAKLADLHDIHGKHPIVHAIVRDWALNRYRSESCKEADMRELENVLVAALLPEQVPKSASKRTRANAERSLRAKLQRTRTRSRAGQLDRRLRSLDDPDEDVIEASGAFQTGEDGFSI